VILRKKILVAEDEPVSGMIPKAGTILKSHHMDDATYKEIKNDMITFLKEKFVMDLATCVDNKPAVAPVVYVIDEDLQFYFVTYTNTLKSNNLIKNPQCSFVIWEFLKMSVQASGVASVVEDEAKKEWVIEAFADAATKDPNFWAPIFRIKRGDYMVFQIKPTWMRVLDLTHSTVRQIKSPFTEIKM